MESKDDGAAIVCIHGSPSPRSDFLPVSEVLGASHRVWLASSPGYDGCTPLSGEYSVERARRVLEDDLSSRGIHSAWLVGFSFGAYQALAIALNGRINARGVICLGGFSTLSAELREGLAGFAAALRDRVDLRDVAPSRFLSAGALARHPEAGERVKRWLDLASPDALADELYGIAKAPNLDLSELQCPVIARVGELDVAAPVALSEHIVQETGGELQVVSGVGHALLIEDVEGTVGAIAKAVGCSEGGEHAHGP